MRWSGAAPGLLLVGATGTGRVAAGKGAKGAPLYSIRGDEIGPLDADADTLRALARAWYNEHLRGRKVVNRASGRQVEFRGSRKAFHTSADPDRLRLFAALEAAVAQGQFKNSSAPGDSKAEPTARAYHWLEAQVQLGGRTVRLGVTIREDADGKLYYNPNEINKAPSSTRSTPPHKGGVGIDDGASVGSGVQVAEDVNLSIEPIKGEGVVRPVRLELEGWEGSASELAQLARRVYTEGLQGTSVANASLGADVA